MLNLSDDFQSVQVKPMPFWRGRHGCLMQKILCPLSSMEKALSRKAISDAGPMSTAALAENRRSAFSINARRLARYEAPYFWNDGLRYAKTEMARETSLAALAYLFSYDPP
jgi:hypothetical protein